MKHAIDENCIKVYAQHRQSQNFFMEQLKLANLSNEKD